MSTFANQANSHNHPVVPKNGIFSKTSWLTLAIGGSVLLAPEIAISQPITPATGANGTGTTITTPDGQQFDIKGGARSGDGANLFHSFEQFGLNQGQTANFISTPEIRNILGRVVGGDPSIINGLIQVTGGTSNLFLMNPAGILFGPNASLNIPADFTATTANGIGFGNNQWFHSFGSNDYINLVGTPSAFSFNMSQLGTIINEGNLTLTPGSNLNLFANTVINTGTLATPGGNINITAVPNGNTLRISQPGHILSLEIENRFVGVIRESPLLPELLTGGDPIHHATTVTKQADGTIRLTGSQTPIPLEPGVAVVSGNVDVGGLKPNPALSGAEGYELNILGDKIALIGANIDASGTNGGGNIHIGGNYQGAGPLPNATHTYIDTFSNITANAISGGNGGQIIIWSDNTTQFHGNISATGIENGGFVEVSGKQNLIFRGNVDLSATSGNTGTLLLDPENIYIVNGTGGADDLEIADAQILWDDPFGFPYGTDYTISEQALESLNGNANVTLQATNDIVINDLADNELAFQPGFGSINLNADYDNDGFGSFVMSPGDRITALGRSLFITAANNIITGTIDTGTTGNVSLYTGFGSIQTADATTQVTANNAILIAPNGIGTASQPLEINVGKLEVTLGAGGAFLNSPNSGVTLGEISPNPAAVAIYNGGTFSLTAAGDIISNSWGQFIGTDNNSAGNIILTSTNGSISINGWGNGNLNTSYYYGDSGIISLTAANDINIDSAGLFSSSISGKGGDISITSTGGSVNITNSGINSYAQSGNAGTVTIKAAGDINIPSPTTISTYSSSGNGGELDINSTNGGINIGNIRSVSESQDAGSVKLEAAGDINTLSIYASATGNGGNIDIISHSGNINTSNGQLISFTAAATAGTINLQAAGNITTGLIDAYAQPAPNSNTTGNGGDITINSTGGTVNASAGSLRSYAAYGDAGDVNIEAAGDITTGYITSLTYSPNPTALGGDISITSYNGGINTTAGNLSFVAQIADTAAIADIANTFLTTEANIDPFAPNGFGGDINLQAKNDIITSHLSSYGGAGSGDVNITSSDGNINTGVIFSVSPQGNGGNITIKAPQGDITTSHINSYATQNGSGGFVDISAGGDFNIGAATINSFSGQNAAGDVTINVGGNINLGGDANRSAIRSEGPISGGNISITSGGEINTASGSLDSYSASGTAGNVTLNGLLDIATSNIRSEGAQVGGDITVTSDTGTITAAGNLNSFSQNGTAGDVTLDAATGIDIANIRSEGAKVGGDITVTTAGTFTSDTINSYATDAATGAAGNVTIEATGNITLGGDATNSAIRSEGAQVGGNISITSNMGGITAAGNLNSFSQNGTAGNVTLDAATGIDIANIRSEGAQQGGSIEITSDADLDLSQTTLNSYSENGTAGDVTLSATGNISLGGDATNSAIRSEGAQVGGDISIISDTGTITAAGNLNSFSQNGTAGDVTLDAATGIDIANIRSEGAQQGGSIEITSDADLDLSQTTLNSYSENGTAGDVTLSATGNITLGGDATNSAIRSEGLQQGGNISITSTTGQIDATQGRLDSYSAAGTAGNVTIEALDNITTAAILSDGQQVGGNITITSNSGNIDVSLDNLESYSSEGTAGNVTLTAPGDITTEDIISDGRQIGGNITITSTQGKIEAAGGNLYSFSEGGQAGNVSLNAPGDIATAEIFSNGYEVGGNIDIATTGGQIDATGGSLNSYSENGTAGNVTLSATGNITLGGDANNNTIRSEGLQQGGNISITSTTGEIDAKQGRLDSYSPEGTAGNVTLNAAANITTAGILSDGQQVGGNIAITSSGGSVDTSRDNLESYSSEGTAGNVTIEAPGDITTEDIISDGQQIGGNITITSTQGKIEAAGGNLYSFSEGGQAGNVSLNAPGDIATAEIFSNGYEVGGNIDIATTGGQIDATGGSLNSYSENGTAGNVTLSATGNITLGGDANNSAIRSEGLQQGGNISITSATGQIDATQGRLDSYSAAGTAGNVTIEALGNITTAAILSDGKQVGGNIAITSNSGDIDVSLDNLESYSSEGTAGNVTLTAPGDITTEDIISDGRQLGGNITITSNQGKIEAVAGNLYSFSEAGKAGNVSLNASGDIATAEIFSDGYEVGGNIDITTTGGQIDTSAGSLNSYSENGTAGNVTLNAPGDIATGNIRSEGLEVGGNIDITTAGTLDLSAATLNSYSEKGTAGNVTLSATGNITLGGDAENSAIRSEGLQQGGNISITSANGEVYTRQGNLDSFSNAGTAGNVFVRANGNINTASIRSEGAKQGGSIVILSFDGNVDTWGNLNSFSSNGTAGDLAIQAKDNINTFGIRSDGYVQGGLVRLISSTGAINTSWGTLDSYSIGGTAGSVLLEASGSITTGAIRSEGLTQGGSISISSYQDAINTTGGNLQSFSPNGTAGNVSLNAPGKITTGSIISHGRFVGGNISINSGSDEGINTSAGVLETYSTDGSAGNVTLSAPGDIITGGGGYWVGDGSGCLVVGAPCLPPRSLGVNGEVAPGADGTFVSGGQFTNLGSGIRSQGWLRGGKIEIISDRNIDTSLGNLDSYSENGIAGDVIINAGGSFTASNITSYGNFQSGNVGIFSENGAIRTGTIRTISPNGTSGNVTLNTFSHQGDIITADITSEGGLAAGNIEALAPDGTITTGDLTSRSVVGDAGDITVAAGGDVETGDISSLGGGNSGDITVTSTGGNVTTGDIASIAETGSAGDITVAGFGDVNTGTIISSGATGDGNIIVTSATGTVNGGDVSVQPQPVQSESPSNGAIVVNQPTANSNAGDIINNLGAGSNIANTVVNIPVTDIANLISSAGENVSNINNSVVVRGDSNGSSGGDNSGEIGLSSSGADVAKTISVLSSSPLAVATSDAAVAALDKSRESEFEEYFGGNLGQNLTSTASTREAMVKIAEETGYKSAVIYVMAQPEQLELIVMTGTGQPIRKTVPDAPREKLLEVVSQFRSQLTATRLGKRTDGYRKPAEQLYQWLIAPIEGELQAAGVNTLLLSMDSGLRSLPMAALYDGKQFLVEKYSMSQIPSISLVDTTYRTLKDTRVLAMGASTFTELNPLPAVPIELSTISQKLWSGVELINENFTQENLISERKKYPYPIIHLATHGEFQAGAVEDSYIQLWGEEKLRLNELRELGWNNPPVELLVLSACRTALGDTRAEMGFAGLAVQAGVKTALASLWSVSDEGTLALMTEFYRNLENSKIKAEALRQAQIAMIRGELQVSAGELRSSGGTRGAVALPPELSEVENSNLSHPYYWSAFMMIGSPW